MTSRLFSWMAGSALVAVTLSIVGCSESSVDSATSSADANASPLTATAKSEATTGSETTGDFPPVKLPDPSETTITASESDPFQKIALPDPRRELGSEGPSFSEGDAMHRGPWLTDFKKAVAQAKAEGKDILMDFTGSDWCGWCIRLNQEVFSKDEFIKYAPQRFVLLELDFPRGEGKISDETRQQNEELQAKFQVEGFPSIVLADSQGRPYAMTGYQQGGPAAYVPHLEELRKVRVTRDELLAKAGKAQGVERAKLLDEALDSIPPNLTMVAYRSVVDDIIKLDANNEAGLKDEYQGKVSEGEFKAAWQQFVRKHGRSEDIGELLGGVADLEKKFASYNTGLQQLIRVRLQILMKFEKAAEFDKTMAAALKSKSATHEDRLQLYMLKMQPLAEARKFAEAEAVIAEGILALEPSAKEKPELLVQLHVVRAQILKDMKQIDKAKAALKSAKQLAPKEIAARIDEIAMELFEDEETPTIQGDPSTLKPNAPR